MESRVITNEGGGKGEPREESERETRGLSFFYSPLLESWGCPLLPSLFHRLGDRGSQQLSPLTSVLIWDFPGGTVVKNPPANAGDTGSSPGLGRSHMPQSNKPVRHNY